MSYQKGVCKLMDYLNSADQSKQAAEAQTDSFLTLTSKLSVPEAI